MTNEIIIIYPDKEGNLVTSRLLTDSNIDGLTSKQLLSVISAQQELPEKTSIFRINNKLILDGFTERVPISINKKWREDIHES